MKTYKKFVTERKGDTVVFTFGRFNPPTVGHEKLITAVQSVARTRGGDFFVYPSHSQDPKKNPLNQATKIKYMKKMFPKFKKNIIASSGKTALNIAAELYKKKYTTLVMVVGSDRVDEFQRILDKYNGQDLAHGFYDFDQIYVVSAGERDPDAEGVEGMSASKMRAAAVAGDFKSFRMGTPKALSDSDTKQLFNDIRKGMRLEVVKEGSKWKNIDFNIEIVEETKNIGEVSYKGYSTAYLHTSPEAFSVIDEMVNSLSGLNRKDEFYLKEAISTLDDFLLCRQGWLKEKKINQKDMFQLENLGKRYIKFMDNIKLSEHFDNSFIYKYISEASETVEYTNKTILDENSKIAEFVRKKMKITKENAWNIVRKAQEMGIDPIKIQQKWAILGPSLMNIVAEYRPKEK